MKNLPISLTRQEGQLLLFFRNLPPEHQLALLSEAESCCTTFARMEELAVRQTERAGCDGVFPRH